jgi:hypothetical protein
VLGYAPFLMGLTPLRLGAVFCAWGILVAIFAVFGADAAEAGADTEAGADGQPGPVPVPGPARTGQAGQSATVTSVPLTVTMAAGVDASRHSV